MATRSTAQLAASLTDAMRLLSDGDIPTAEAAVRAVVAEAPEESEGHNALGIVLRKAGQADAAEQAWRAALALNPDNPRVHRNLGDLYRAQGKADAAIAALLNALRVDPANYQLHHLLAKLEHDCGRHAAAETGYRAYLAYEPDDIEALTDLGMALAALGRDNEAVDMFERALRIAPRHLPAEFGLRETIARLVPPWHLPMMNEPKRNHAYRDAIRAVVRPDDLVLDIGTGAGLLALLAAEAGAKQVVSCEMVEVVAKEATAIVTRSDWADRIAVVPKNSARLEVGDDLPERADVLVSEILANDFVGEGVLPSLIDARRRLLKPDARIVPARGALMGALVGGPEIAWLLGLGDVCGFDMASFARLRPWRQPISHPIDYDAYSDDLALIDYDFHDIETLADREMRVPVTVTRPGLCYGVLQWISLELAPGITYDNHPRTTNRCGTSSSMPFRNRARFRPETC